MQTLVLIIINKQTNGKSRENKETQKQELRTKLRNKATVKQRPTPNN